MVDAGEVGGGREAAQMLENPCACQTAMPERRQGEWMAVGGRCRQTRDSREQLRCRLGLEWGRGGCRARKGSSPKLKQRPKSTHTRVHNRAHHGWEKIIAEMFGGKARGRRKPKARKCSHACTHTQRNCGEGSRTGNRKPNHILAQGGGGEGVQRPGPSPSHETALAAWGRDGSGGR